MKDHFLRAGAVIGMVMGGMWVFYRIFGDVGLLYSIFVLPLLITFLTVKVLIRMHTKPGTIIPCMGEYSWEEYCRTCEKCGDKYYLGFVWR